jgi:hypothetical protein
VTSAASAVKGGKEVGQEKSLPGKIRILLPAVSHTFSHPPVPCQVLQYEFEPHQPVLGVTLFIGLQQEIDKVLPHNKGRTVDLKGGNFEFFYPIINGIPGNAEFLLQFLNGIPFLGELFL